MSASYSDPRLSALIDALDVLDGIKPPPLPCTKCQGSGTFTARSGRVVGPCFHCGGKGVEPAVKPPVELLPGQCGKCGGTGEWRPGRQCLACKGTGKVGIEADIDVSAIDKAFQAARNNGVKAPKLRLADFRFSRAADTSKNPGAIYVTRVSDNEYLGKVTGGQFRPVIACDDPTKTKIIEVAVDPHNAAIAYGQKTGRCSVCNAELSNAESIAASMGPICRGKFGWG